MSRRIGIITYKMTTSGETDGSTAYDGQTFYDGSPTLSGGVDVRRHYLWDVKTLSHLQYYAGVLKDWTRANAVELIWCNQADVVFYPDRSANEKRVFVFHEPAETDLNVIPGSTEEGLYLEYVASCYFRVTNDGFRFQRRVGFPAPITSIFARGGKISSGIGSALEDTLEQVTGVGIFKFVSGILKIYPIVEDER